MPWVHKWSVDTFKTFVVDYHDGPPKKKKICIDEVDPLFHIELNESAQLHQVLALPAVAHLTQVQCGVPVPPLQQGASKSFSVYYSQIL